MLSGVEAAPDTSGICLIRLQVAVLGSERRSLQQLNAMKAAWCKMEGKILHKGQK